MTAARSGAENRHLAGRDRYVTFLLRDVHCAGCGWRSTVSGSVAMITDAPQVPPVTALTF